MRNNITKVHTPETVAQALDLLAESGPAVQVLAGGTDLMVRARRGTLPPEVTALVSLHRIGSIRGVHISIAGDQLTIGAATTASELIRSSLITEHIPILGQVAKHVASAQIRNQATIGGNLVNASPAGDLINPLLLLEAELELAAPGRTRVVPVGEFFPGPGATVLQPGELLARITCPVPPPERVFRFVKAGTRPAMECSLVTVGLAYSLREGMLHRVRIAYGSCAPTALVGSKTEAVLEGQLLTPQLITAAINAAGQDISPISDIRGSANYRRTLVGEYLRRLLDGQPRSR